LTDAGAASLWPRRARAAGPAFVALGQISLDRVAWVAGWPSPGGKQALEAEELLPGGQAATAALAATRLGVATAWVGAVGDDEAGRASLAPLRAAGVELSGARVLPGATSRQALVLCERGTGERSVLERRDPALRLAAEAVPEALIAGAGALLVDAEHPEASLHAIRIARRAGVATLCDVDRADAASRAIAAEVDFPIVSEGFAEATGSGVSAQAALRKLSGPHTRMLVLTRGERGAVALAGDRALEVPALEIQAVDTTGAGDVFRGAFAAALLEGLGARETLAFASAAAGLACLGRGAQGALPARDQVAARLARAG
jgi:sugar/nucleoside kinase (ribokinase family)